MSGDIDNIQNPNNMTPEALAALRASDPSAFDDDVPSTGAEDDDDDKVKEPVEDDKTETPDKVADKEPPADDAIKHAPKVIPEPRFAEVVAQRNAAEEAAALKEAENQALLQEIATLKGNKEAAPQRDFVAEHAELMRRYDEDGDLTFAEYEAEKFKLLADMQKADVDAKINEREKQREQNEQQKLQETIDQDWKSANIDWKKANTEFLALPGASVAMQNAINFVDSENPELAPTELLAKAHEVAARMIGVEIKTPQANKTTTRAVDIARASSAAANTPPVVTGGVGSRGGPQSTVDVANIKPGNFSKLPKDKQEELLGPGAL